MAAWPRPLLLLLLLLGGSAAHPALPRAPRHSDGAFTSELSRLRESARLQRLLQGLVGKRSEPDTETGTAWTRSARGHFCTLWPDWLALQAWAPPREPRGPAWSTLLPPSPRSRPEVLVSQPAAPRLRGPS